MTEPSQPADGTGFLLPDADEHSAPFWEACARGDLVVQACGGCGRLRFPPRPMCPWCNSLDATWEPLSGRGRIWSYVVAHPPLLPAYQERAPYPVVLVELAEDPTLRMVGNLVAAPGFPIDSIDPDDLHIGMEVEATFEEVAERVSLPRWVPRTA